MNMNNIERFPKNYDKSSVRVICTPSFEAKKAFFYVQETGYLKIINSHNTKRNNLESYLLVYVVSGSGTLKYNGTTYNVNAEECFFIDCSKKHSYESSNTSPWEIFWVHFNGATSKEYYNIIVNQYSNVFKIDTANDAILNIYNELISINKDGKPFAELISSELIVSLLTNILKEKYSENDIMNEKLSEVKQYIDAHFTEKISLEYLTEAFYISKYHLIRIFKKKYHKTITEYIIYRRINYAKRLLRFTNKSIEEISELTGFCDQNYFNKQFKKIEGITGSSYRKKWK